MLRDQITTIVDRYVDADFPSVRIALIDELAALIEQLSTSDVFSSPELRMSARPEPEISSSQVVKEAWACIWEENIDAVWQTSCGNAYQFTDGGPSDNRAEYCIYCGKPISELALADEQEKR